MRKQIHHPAGEDPWPADSIIYGPRAHWRVTGARAIESRVWVNSWEYTVEPLGDHGEEFEQLHRRGEHCVVPTRRGEDRPDLRV